MDTLKFILSDINLISTDDVNRAFIGKVSMQVVTTSGQGKWRHLVGKLEQMELNFPFYWICLLCSWRDKSSYRSNAWVRCASGNVYAKISIFLFFDRIYSYSYSVVKILFAHLWALLEPPDGNIRKKNIARGTTDPGYWLELSLQLNRMPLALVPNWANM